VSGVFDAVDLPLLAAPDVVEAINYEEILAAMLADLRARAPEFDALVESDPAYKILEVAAYRETLIRQRVNDGALAVMLAYAAGSDLDQIAANYNLSRFVLVIADPVAIPPIEAVFESDTDLRRRVQLSFEGFSTAGPVGAYVFHALGSDPDVLDAAVASPTPGDVVVTILSRQGDGAPSAGLLTAVGLVLSADEVRPLTDNVAVVAATIINFAVDATLTLYSGPDAGVVLGDAEAALALYISSQRRLGRDVTRSGLFAALHQPGVQNVTLTAPAADVVIASNEAAFCTGTSVVVGGTDV
jgi:phage-related baseplate assembly protein